MLIGAPHNHAPCSQAWDKWLSFGFVSPSINYPKDSEDALCGKLTKLIAWLDITSDSALDCGF